MIQRMGGEMINLHESMGPAGIELMTPGSTVRLASVARHVTDCLTRPGLHGMVLPFNIEDRMILQKIFKEK